MNKKILKIKPVSKPKQTRRRKGSGCIFKRSNNFYLKVNRKGVIRTKVILDSEGDFHSLRHTFGTKMAHKLSSATLMHVMGHSDIQTTINNYYHHSDERAWEEMNQD